MLHLSPHICIWRSFALDGSKKTSIIRNSKDTMTSVHHLDNMTQLSSMISIETNGSGSSGRVIRIRVRVSHIQIYTCTCSKSGCEDKGNQRNNCTVVLLLEGKASGYEISFQYKIKSRVNTINRVKCNSSCTIMDLISLPQIQ